MKFLIFLTYVSLSWQMSHASGVSDTSENGLIVKASKEKYGEDIGQLVANDTLELKQKVIARYNIKTITCFLSDSTLSRGNITGAQLASFRERELNDCRVAMIGFLKVAFQVDLGKKGINRIMMGNMAVPTTISPPLVSLVKGSRNNDLNTLNEILKLPDIK